MQSIKIIRNNSLVVVILSNGTSFQSNDLSEEDFNKICSDDVTEEDIIAIFNPNYKDKVLEAKKVSAARDKVTKSKILTFRNDAVFWEDVSTLSMPKELVEAILKAEEANDTILLETYKNFWTLMYLNPDEQCRLNLFWFLNRNGLVINRCGFFVAYRNVNKHKEYSEDNELWTDAHTGTFTIKIGDMVTMPREKCDSRQDVTCSKGLHLGSKDWLTKDYYGSQGLVCLCNPAEVVAVPHEDHYGKLRTCAYLPIAKAKYDDYGKVIPYDAKDGFECEYVPKVIYEGLLGTEKDTNYKLIIPEIPGIDRESIANKLLDIARETISQRVK